MHLSLETIAKGNVKINMNAGTLTMEQGIKSQVELLKDYFSTELCTYSLQHIKIFLEVVQYKFNSPQPKSLSRKAKGFLGYDSNRLLMHFLSIIANTHSCQNL